MRILIFLGTFFLLLQRNIKYLKEREECIRANITLTLRVSIFERQWTEALEMKIWMMVGKILLIIKLYIQWWVSLYLRIWRERFLTPILVSYSFTLVQDIASALNWSNLTVFRKNPSRTCEKCGRIVFPLKTSQLQVHEWAEYVFLIEYRGIAVWFTYFCCCVWGLHDFSLQCVTGTYRALLSGAFYAK